MKKIILSLVLILTYSITFSQVVGDYINPAAKLTVTNAVGSNPYTLTVSVSDDLSRFTFDSITAGCYVYLIDGSNLLVYTVNSKLTSPNRLVVTDINNTGISPPTGQGAVMKVTDSSKLPMYISGLRDDLRSMIMNKLSQQIDAKLLDAKEIYQYVGITGVSPAVTAAVAGSITAQNTVGQLWTWNPASNLTSGSWSLQGNSTTITPADSLNVSLKLTGGVLKGSVIPNTLDSNVIKDKGIGASDLSQGAVDTLKSQLNTDSISSSNAFLRLLATNQKTATQLKATFVGDSRTEFDFTSYALKTTLQKRYKFHGDLGYGFAGFGVSEFRNSTKTLASATLVDNTGDALYSTGGKCYTLTVQGASFVQYALANDTFSRFTDLKVYYLQKTTGGTFQVSVDGVVLQTVNTNGTLSVQSVLITGLSDAVHTVRFNYTTGGSNVSLLDMFVTRNTSSGIQVNHVGHGGWTTYNFLTIMNNNMKWYQENPSDLYIIRFGGNDINNDYSGATIAIGMDSIAKKIKKVVPNASFLMLSETDLGVQGNITKVKAQETVVAVKKMCQIKGYEFLDLYTLIPNWEQFYAQGLGDQYIHENEQGGVVIGNYIYEKLTKGSSFSTAVSVADSTWLINGTAAYRTGDVAISGKLSVSSDILFGNFASTKVSPVMSNTSGVFFKQPITQNAIPYYDSLSGWINSNVYSTGGTMGIGRLVNINTNSKAHIALSEVPGVTMANYFDVLTIEGSTRNGIAFKSANTTDAGLSWNSPSSGSSGSAFVYHNYSTGALTFATNQSTGSLAFYAGAASLKMKLLSTGNLGINTATPTYKLDIDANTGSTGNPIRLQGLLIGSTTDSIITSANGVLKRLSLGSTGNATWGNDITTGLRINNLSSTDITTAYPSGLTAGTMVYNSTLGVYQFGDASGTSKTVALISPFSTTYNTAIAAGAEATVTVAIAGLTTNGSVVLNWSGTKGTGLIIQPCEISGGNAIIHINNTTLASITPNLTFLVTAIKL
jgi:predicted Rdx family selenoprotein